MQATNYSMGNCENGLKKSRGPEGMRKEEVRILPRLYCRNDLDNTAYVWAMKYFSGMKYLINGIKALIPIEKSMGIPDDSNMKNEKDVFKPLLQLLKDKADIAELFGTTRQWTDLKELRRSLQAHYDGLSALESDIQFEGDSGTMPEIPELSGDFNLMASSEDGDIMYEEVNEEGIASNRRHAGLET
jgi:hypothetical protein